MSLTHYEDYTGVPMDRFNDVLDDVTCSSLAVGFSRSCGAAMAYVEKAGGKGRVEEVKPRDYHRGETLIGTMLPGTVGYGAGNCMQNVWGIGCQKLLRERFKRIAGECGVIPSTATYRVLRQDPGQTVPWHVDSMQAWRDEFHHWEPRLIQWYERKAHSWDVEACASRTRVHAGPYKGHRFGRRIVCLEDHQPGHLIQFGKRIVDHWYKGQTLATPPGVWHTTTNFGIVPRWSLTVTGVFS